MFELVMVVVPDVFQINFHWLNIVLYVFSCERSAPFDDSKAVFFGCILFFYLCWVQ